MKAKELRDIRDRLDWTQARLAEVVGVTSNSIARQERGVMGIRESLARLIRIIAEQAEQNETTAHAGSSGGYSASKSQKGSKPRRSKSKGRAGARKNSVQRR